MQEKNKHKFNRLNSTMKNIRFEDELLDLIEKRSGKGNFSSWVKQACIQRIELERSATKG